MSRLLIRKMAEAESYDQWRESAIEYDQRKGLDQWKAREKTALYDYKAIRNRLHALRGYRESNDNAAVLFTLNEGIHGNLGGMGRSSLYQRAKFGTKDLIVDYTDEVVSALEHLASAKTKDITMHDKHDFFHRAHLCYGILPFSLFS